MANDGESPMDLDILVDLDAAPSTRPAGPSTRRFQPKVKVKVKAEPVPEPVKKKDEGHRGVSDAIVKDKEEEEYQGEKRVPLLAPDSGPASTSGDGIEVEDGGEAEEEDTVVEEIDVFFNPGPIDEDTLLCVMQYPLRPTWRPYELDERCLEVKLKLKEMKVEVDLRIDMDSENYDHERPEFLKLHKQTLSSSNAPLVTNYAIGVLKDRKVFLNSLHAVLQLRPSMEYYNASKHNHAAFVVENISTNNGEPAKSNQAAVVSKENADDAEPWISLKYKARDSDSANKYLGKMVVKSEEHIQFTMTTSDYIDLLCQGTLAHNKRAKIPSISHLLSMPLEERLKKWLSEVTVNRFNALKHLAPEISEEDLPKILALHADLVQGVWVTKSSLVYPDEKARRLRDYILSLFSKSPIIYADKLKGVPPEVVRRVMGQLARERHMIKDRKEWKFKEATDFSFIKKYPDIVKEHECAWSACEKEITDSRSGSRGNLGQKISQNVNNATSMIPGEVDINPHKSKGSSTSSGLTDVADETQEHLQKALIKLFQDQKVRSFNSIIRGLRDMAIKISSHPKFDESKSSKILDAVKKGASMPPIELDPVISKVAVKVHGVYMLSTLGSQAIDPIRNVVINLFRGKEANAKLTKQDIHEAVRYSLKKDIKDSDYKQVMQELCDSNRGSWMLKSGD